MKKIYSLIVCLVLINFLFTGCHNKDLCPECDQETGVEVKFNWQNVKDIPEGMTVLFYSPNGDLKYTFQNIPASGRLIRIDAGTYQVACYNNDTEYVRWSGQDSISTLQVTMREGGLTEDHTRASTPPEIGRLVVMPDDLYGDVLHEITIKPFDPELQVILLTPQTLLDFYTYEVSNIINAKYITNIRATLSGLSEIYFLGNPEHQVKSCTMPFMGNLSEQNQEMIVGEMQNFGYFRDPSTRNLLTLYLWSPGGNIMATFDVTNQVRNAPDPRNVHIIINTTITVPPPIEGDDGIDPSVDEWKDITFDIIM